MLTTFALVGGAPVAEQGPTAFDLSRARTKVPRSSFKGHGQSGLSVVLNGHLRRTEDRHLDCDEWTPKKLQTFMGVLNEHRSPELQEIYQFAEDRRTMQLDKPADYTAHWARLNDITASNPALLSHLRETHCREAVMWWTHHLTEDKRVDLRALNLTVPLLPEGEKRPCDGSSSADAQHLCVSIEQPNSCDWCHSTQARHDAGEPGTTAPNALNPKYHGPDDGNPHGWDRKRRCDQDQMPRCQLCEGVGGHAWADKNSDIDLVDCEIVATPDKVDNKTVHWPLYPKQFQVMPLEGRPGYSDTRKTSGTQTHPPTAAQT